MTRIVKSLCMLALLMVAVASVYAKTLVWGDFDGGVSMSYADGAYQACPGDGYPESGHDLTSCQQIWYDGGL